MNHFISLAQAIQMTTLYRERKETVLADQYKGQDILPLSEAFARAAFDKVLSQPGCERLRIYYGMDDQLKTHAIVVGVDAQNQDILPPSNMSPMSDESTQALAETSGSTISNADNAIIEVAQRCPPYCQSSPLNP